jgi:disulfide bond formation protein DsbB
MKILQSNIIKIFVFLGIASFLTLEFIFKLPPCELCKIQRIPYYIAGIFCLFFSRKPFFLHTIIVLFFFASCISIFHVLVENQVFEFSCNSEMIAQTIEQLKLEILNAKPDCASKSYIFGLRITFLSTLLNLFIIFLATFLLHSKRK